VIVRYDDDRKDLGGEVSSQIAASVGSVIEKVNLEG
jgi:hypothetical protein